ncbi:(deoxy)nucleoside triphosphate pyrophosphohydrolase [Geomonas sp. RF6]|uniref:(deoxy)nucleoside triphosphate pyrophosphohydrolase n=1 Tax=Geomonas sp. RF6 TaxID=2897342 RepID=UPI001E5F3DE3|nr:(deoxy)nucleoside triphosphate pyrophosphohydrolase [Geomonas sp. RF6]UFS71161.1 (deoxy)nucleoside triphosphate pyrophosphohydrolase [Geomonas sp. RF6]
MTGMRHIHVTCAIIERDGLVLAAQRSTEMSLPLKWEFPGGKIDEGETTEECLRRELIEELGIEVVLKDTLEPVTYHYPTLAVTLYPFICAIKSGEVVLHEHAAVAWLSAGELETLDWAAADIPVLQAYLAAPSRCP